MTEKITILVANPFAHDVSGNDEALLRLMSRVNKERFRFVVAMPGESPYTDRYRQMGASVEIVPMSIIKRNLHPAFLAEYFGSFVPTIARFVKLIKKHGIHIVHTNTTQILGAGAAARWAGLPSLYHVHSVNIAKPAWVGRLMAAWIRHTADALLANSRASGHIFLKRGFPRDKLVILPNSVDLDNYGPSLRGARMEVRRELEKMGLAPLSKGEPLIGLAGRIAPIKGIEHFIEAAAIVVEKFPMARFVVAGGAQVPAEIAYLAYLKRRVERLNLRGRILFTGRRTDIPRVMAAMDALVLASSSEGFGLVLIEALAASVPVVGSEVGGVVEIIDDGENGYLVPYGAPSAIARALVKIISNPDRARKMGEAGRKKVERLYSADRLAKALEEVYISVLNRQEAGGG